VPLRLGILEGETCAKWAQKHCEITLERTGVLGGWLRVQPRVPLTLLFFKMEI